MLSAKRKKQLILGITLTTASLFMSPMVQATDTAYSDGNHFKFTFYNENEPWSYSPYSDTSTYTLNDWEKRHIEFGASYWEHVLASSFTNTSVIPILIDTNEIDNASAYSVPTNNPVNGYYMNELEASVLYQYTSSTATKDVAFISIGRPQYPPDETEEVYLTPLPQLAGGPNGALALTMIHEMGHALGVSASIDSYILGKTNGIDNIYNSHLYDWRGIQATPGMVVRTDNHKVTADTYFDLPGSDVDSSFLGIKLPYFSGPHVLAVLDGATIATYSRGGIKLDQSPVPGIPLNGLEGTGSGEYKERVELSHLELRNSQMSHQSFRNYSVYMEAELALLQDLGYTIDLRNFYGRSIYNNGLSITNTSPYYARNDAGTDYITGAANKETYGIGLHVYGNNNTIYQAADLLADGAAAVGIRLDGLDNNIIVNKGTKIEANGLNGNGILVAFGKNHTVSLAQGSTVTALGTGGIGAAFDFSTNMIGYYVAARASYASRGSDYQLASSVEVDGPLVTNFNVNGTLAGAKDAIYMASNAYVKNVTIGDGAAIAGDITNDWLYDYPDIVNYGNQAHAAYPKTIPENIDKTFFRQYTGTDELTTKLSFANTNGMAYSGNITGQKNTRLSFDAGTTAYTGTAKVLSTDIAAGAALIGNGTFSLMTPADAATHTLGYVLNPYKSSTNGTLTGVGLFTNHGTISPTSGNISVTGDFISNGTLGAAMTSSTQANAINISGSADLTGSTLAIISNVAPLVGNTYNYLTGSTVTGTVTPVNPGPYVTLSTGINGSNAYFSTVRTGVTLSSLPGMTSSESSVGAALEQDLQTHLANDPTSAETAELNNLLFQSEAASRAATRQITNVTRAQLIAVSPLTAMTTGATYDRLDTALYDGNINVDVPTASFDGVPATMKVSTPMALDTTNNLWFKLLRGYESYGGTGGGYDLNNKSFGGVIGYDRAVNGTTRVGGLFSYAKTDYSTDVLDGKSHDWRVGIYASHDNGTWKTQGLISYGHNRYDFNRYSLGNKLYSDYTAKVFDINAKVKYLPQYNRVKSWQVAPYVGLAYTHTNQGAYTEEGTSGLAQSIDSASNNSYRAEVGVEWKHDMSKDSSFGGSIGYKRVLSGVNPELNGTFAGDTNRFTLSSDNDRNYATYSLNLKKNTGHNWTMQGEVRGERSAHNHSEVYSVMAKYSF